MQESERSAERVAPVAQTTHPTRAGLAWVLNSLVVPPFLRRGNLRGCKLACGATLCATREFAWLELMQTRFWCHSFCDAGICVAGVDANSLVVSPFLRRGNLRDLCGCFVHTFEWFFYFAASSCTLVKWNSRASNNPKSLSFKAGIGSNAKKLSVINGALNVAPTSRVIDS